jgi:hypothetical protein
MQNNQLYKVICDIPEDLKQDLKKWIEDQSNDIKSSIDRISYDHITIFYGIEESNLFYAERIVKSFYEMKERGSSVELDFIEVDSTRSACFITANSIPWRILRSRFEGLAINDPRNHRREARITIFNYKNSSIKRENLRCIDKMVLRTFTLENIHIVRQFSSK